MIPVNTNFPDHIIAALDATFPELDHIESIAVMREGFRNVVVETSSGDVFKIAKNWEASATFAKERHFLMELGSSLSVPVPYPLWHSGRSSLFPFGVLGYPKLDGAPLGTDGLTSNQMQSFAQGIARFILSLHCVGLSESMRKSLPGPEIYWYRQARVPTVILPILRDELPDEQYATVESWWDSFLADPRMRSYTPALQHGDLMYDNILMDGATSRISGIVDFENLALGDPAQDFATQLYLGTPFTEAVLEHYQTAGGILDSDVRYRMQKLWELRGFDGMQLAIHFEDQGEFDAALARLLNGPILNETTRRDTTIWQPRQD